MSNSLLTPTIITKEALSVLHQKANFIGSINKQYDPQFAKTGAKIGSSLSIREPNQFTVTTGAALNVQDITESSQTLTVSTQAHVDFMFSTADLTMTIDMFSERYLDPAMSRLAAYIENDAMSMAKDVYQSVWQSAADLTYSDVLDARTLIQNGLAPGGMRTANLNSTDQAALIKDTKTLFNDQSQLGKQFRDGYMGRAAGFDFMENTQWPGHTTANEDGNYVCNTSTGITSGTATIALTAGANGLNKGDVFTIEGVYRVHPESKAVTADLQQFVVTADYTSGSVSVSPTPITSGAKQNVSITSAGSGKTVTVAGTANTAHRTNLMYNKDAFTFATADLVMPNGVDFSAREVLDGISMRVVRQYDINNDTIPCRIDVLYGYKTIRPEWAAKVMTN
jgi:hypothetical protein